jgi:hypothetical protein
LAVLKGGGKFVHILEDECLRELIMWLQEFVPPPEAIGKTPGKETQSWVK